MATIRTAITAMASRISWQQVAVDQCARAVEARLNNYAMNTLQPLESVQQPVRHWARQGSGRVLGIEDVRVKSSGRIRVRGVATSGHIYAPGLRLWRVQYNRQYGTPDLKFSCAPSVAAAGARWGPPRCSTLGPPRAPQGRRLHRHLGVRGRGRWLHRLPARPGQRAGIRWDIAAALLWIGGCIAAPFAAWLVKRGLQARVLGVAAGGLIVVDQHQDDRRDRGHFLGRGSSAVVGRPWGRSPWGWVGISGIVWSVKQERAVRAQLEAELADAAGSRSDPPSDRRVCETAHGCASLRKPTTPSGP